MCQTNQPLADQMIRSFINLISIVTLIHTLFNALHGIRTRLRIAMATRHRFGICIYISMITKLRTEKKRKRHHNHVSNVSTEIHNKNTKIY